MSEQPVHEWRFYLEDMIDFAKNVIYCHQQPSNSRLSGYSNDMLRSIIQDDVPALLLMLESLRAIYR